VSQTGNNETETGMRRRPRQREYLLGRPSERLKDEDECLLWMKAFMLSFALQKEHLLSEDTAVTNTVAWKSGINGDIYSIHAEAGTGHAATNPKLGFLVTQNLGCAYAPSLGETGVGRISVS
jgi:hypothetical protein